MAVKKTSLNTISGLEKDIQAVQKKLDHEKNKRITNAGKATIKSQAQLKKSQTKLDLLNKKLKSLKSAKKPNKVNIDKTAEALTAQKSEVANNKSELSGLKDQLSALKAAERADKALAKISAQIKRELSKPAATKKKAKVKSAKISAKAKDAPKKTAVKNKSTITKKPTAKTKPKISKAADKAPKKAVTKKEKKAKKVTTPKTAAKKVAAASVLVGSTEKETSVSSTVEIKQTSIAAVKTEESVAINSVAAPVANKTGIKAPQGNETIAPKESTQELNQKTNNEEPGSTPALPVGHTDSLFD